MRIHYLCSVDVPPEPSTGYGIHIHNVVRRLRARGHEVTLFCCYESERAPTNNDPGLVYVSRLPHSLPGLARYSGRYLRALAGHIREKRPDVLYMRYGDWQFVPPLVAELTRIPSVLELNGVPDLDRELGAVHRRLIRATFLQADHIVVKADAMADHVSKSFEISRARFTTVDNGVDCEIYRPRNADERPQLPKAARIIGYVGLLADFAGLELLAEAAPALVARYPEILFAVAGDGPAGPSLVARFRERGLGERLKLVGSLSYEDAARFMSECDALVYLALDLPRNNMQSPLKVFHYLATGVPTVASDLDVIRQFEGSGIARFKAGDPVALAERIGEALELDQVARAELSRRERDFIVRNFTWERAVDKIEGVIERVVGRR